MYNAETFRKHDSFVRPEQMLQGLLSSHVGQCYCNQPPTSTHHLRSQQQIQNAIENLHAQLDSMNHEVIETQSLLNQRDMLYKQLDHLRTEREEIQDEISSQQMRVENECKIKVGSGVKEMNDRLRRRIREIRQYIDKMELENKKIQEVLCMNYNQNEKFHSYTQYGGSCNPTWLQRINQQPTNYKKLNYDYFTNLKKRLQEKEEEAWCRVRKQEQQIHSRNALSQMHFGYRTGGGYPKRHREREFY